MVRLRTNRWYGSAGQQRVRSRVANQSNSSRRLISLCILLALVLVLIQRASDPRYVRNAFSALGVPLDGQSADEQPPVSLADLPAAATVAESTIQRTCRDLIPKIFGDAAGDPLKVLSKRWFSQTQPSGDDSPDRTASGTLREFFDLASTKLSELENTLVEADPQWTVAFKQFSHDFEQLQTNLLSPDGEVTDCRAQLSWEFVFALNGFLDTFLMSTLRDAAPWEPAESLAFWRLLQRTVEPQPRVGAGEGERPAAHLPLINTLQLEAQRSVYRGSSIRFQGSVRRAEWIDKQFPDFGLTGGYGILWLRGADRSQQPVAIYTTHTLAQELSGQQLDAAGTSEFPEIELEGIVAKRLAYGSTAGVQVAPTIFATRLTLLSSPPVAADTAPKEVNITFTVLAAGCVAAAVMIPLFLRQRRQGARKVAAKIARQKLLWFLAVALVGQPSPVTALQTLTDSATLAPQEPPPWARTDTDTKLAELLSSRLRHVLDPTAVADLTEYTAGGEQTAFPDVALKVMHAISQLGWTRTLQLGKQIEFDQGDCSVRVADWVGTARMAMPISLSASQLAWFPYEKLYRIDVELETRKLAATSTNSPPLLHVYCRTLPSSWLVSKQLWQPIALKGLTIFPPRVADGDVQPLPLCVLVDIPDWRIPADTDVAALQPPIQRNWLRLGQHGWNLAWTDLVSARNQGKLASDEQAAFYSFLRVTSNFTDDDAAANQNPLELLGHPRENLGQPVSWLVRIVQATVVQVIDPQTAQDLGADRYYQFDGFVDIGKQKVRYKVPVGSAATAADQGIQGTGIQATGNQGAGIQGQGIQGQEVIEFQGEFPVTIVSLTPHLLTSEQLASNRLSWDILHYARLDGSFYRLWSYHSALLESKGSQARQVAPLIVAQSLELANSPASSPTNTLGWLSVAICVVVLGVLAVIGYYLVQSSTPRRPRRALK